MLKVWIVLSALLAAQPSFAAVRYVNVNSATPISPYTNWAVSSRTIQAAIDISQSGDLILVTNGVYDTGVRTFKGANRIALTRPVTVQSVNGPAFSLIVGERVPATTNGVTAVRCAYLTNGAMLAGFTLTNGATHITGSYVSGGGVYCESTDAVVSNCVLTGNSAYQDGGGAYGSTLYNCTLTGNSAFRGGAANQSILYNCTVTGNSAEFGGGALFTVVNNCTMTGNWANWGGGVYNSILKNCLLADNRAEFGGGAYYSRLVNCTLADNSAEVGGGAYNSTLTNSIVFFNAAVVGENYWESSFNYCCTAPQPPGGPGNITSDPLFIDYASGDLRLRSNSLCINSGWNLAPGSDLDGRPRIAGDAVDIGTYEVQAPASAISYVWLHHYGFTLDGSADSTDPDGDGANNRHEFIAGTIPTDPLSTLRIVNVSAAPQGISIKISITWQSVTNRTYLIERVSNLGAPPPIFVPRIRGRAGTTTFLDYPSVDVPSFFYRVRAQQ
jgi:hypothetical protein